MFINSYCTLYKFSRIEPLTTVIPHLLLCCCKCLFFRSNSLLVIDTYNLIHSFFHAFCISQNECSSIPGLEYYWLPPGGIVSTRTELTSRITVSTHLGNQKLWLWAADLGPGASYGIVCCSCPAILHLKGCSWAAVSCVLITCELRWTTNLTIQDHQNSKTNPVLQCPVSASRGQSPHNEIKPTRAGSCIRSTHKVIRLELGVFFWEKQNSCVNSCSCAASGQA